MQMSLRETFSEVYSVIHLVGDSYISKLPPKLYQLIEENRLESYSPVFSANDLSFMKTLKRETIAMLVVLELNYWCDSEEEKQELQNILNDNSEKYHQKMMEKYSSQNIFKSINETREKQRIAAQEIHQAATKIEEAVKNEETP